MSHEERLGENATDTCAEKLLNIGKWYKKEKLTIGFLMEYFEIAKWYKKLKQQHPI